MWNLNPRPSSWEDFLNKAKQLINIKDYILAEKYITEAIRLKNDEYVLYKIRSSVFVKLNKLNNALDDCQKMIQLKPQDGTGYVRASKLLSEMNDKKCAYQICVFALKKVPSSDKYYNMIEKLMESYRGKRKIENNILKNNVKRFRMNSNSNSNSSLNSNSNSNFNDNKMEIRPGFNEILPYEVICRIFQELPFNDLFNCMLTCKRWYECIISNKSLWRDINLSNSRRYSTNTIQLIAKRSQNMLRTLDLSNCTALSDNSLRSLLLYRCNGLETFKLNYNRKVTFNGIIKLLKIIGPNLINLSLQRTQVNDRVVENIFISCPKLEYLDISECSNITNDCFISVYNMHRKIYNMKGLRLQSITSIYNKTVEICSSLFPSLEVLDLFNCININKISLLAISSLTELKELNLTGTSMSMPENVPLEDFFLFLFEKCQKVEKISLRKYISESSIERLCGFCSNLREVDIGDSNFITNDSLEILSDYLKYTLNSLNISSCQDVTSEGFLHIFNNCEKLTDLDISDNPGVNDELLIKFNNPKLPLVNIKASNCSIKGYGLESFIEKLIDTLSYLNIDYCYIDSTTFRNITHKFPHIRISSKLM